MGENLGNPPIIFVSSKHNTLHNTCRTCLQKGTISLYNNRQFNMINALKMITGVDVVEEDPYTKWICKKCYALLKAAFMFRKKAQVSNKEMRDQFTLRQHTTNILESCKIPDMSSECDILQIMHNSFEATVDSILEKYNIHDLEDDNKSIKVVPEQISISNVKLNPNPLTEVEDYNSDNDSEEASTNFSVSEKHNTYKEKVKLQSLHKKVVCKICKKYVTKKYYNGHLAYHQGILRPDGKYECRVCKKQMLRRSFRSHVAVAHTEVFREFICEHCGKAFKYQGSYARHLICHKSEFPYKCEQCDYRGPTEQLLNSHMRRHTKEYTFQCDQCAARFSFKSSLNRHMMRRHQGKSLKCNDCDKEFYTKTEVDQHHRVEHLGIKNFACNMCDKVFGYRSAMMKHQLGVHKRPSRGFGPTPCYLRDELKN